MMQLPVPLVNGTLHVWLVSALHSPVRLPSSPITRGPTPLRTLLLAKLRKTFEVVNLLKQWLLLMARILGIPPPMKCACRLAVVLVAPTTLTATPGRLVLNFPISPPNRSIVLIPHRKNLRAMPLVADAL